MVQSAFGVGVGGGEAAQYFTDSHGSQVVLFGWAFFGRGFLLQRWSGRGGHAVISPQRAPGAQRIEISADAVEHFFRGHANAGEDRRVLECVGADLNFAQLLYEVEEIVGEIGLKCDDEFLIVDSE